MSESKHKNISPKKANGPAGKGISRRNFLKYAGISAIAATSFGVASCNNNNPENNGGGGMNGKTVSLGSGNVGILNFAYALEQLEAAFYAKATGSMYSGASDNEKAVLNDIAKHEKAHMKFFQKALGDNAIPGLTPDFSKIDFSDKSSVIGTAQVFENLGVQAYNSQGTYIDTSKKNGGTYLLIAGKIVSVEARHAAAVLNIDISNPSGDFANSKEVNDSGLEKTVSGSSEVLQAVAPYIKEKIDGSNLPDQQ
jgi:hypothetical protein